MSLFRFDLVHVESGRVVVSCEPDESMYNAIGLMHGGIACALLDTAASCALLSVLPASTDLVSVEIKVNYVRAIRPDVGILSAEGTVVKAGSRIGFTNGIVTDVNGAVVATASSTLVISDA